MSLYQELAKELSPGELLLDHADLKAFSGDKWFAAALPEAVVKPRDASAVSTVLKFANAHRIPVTPRGAGHGYVGGCVPVQGGIVLSLDHWQRIKEIHPRDFVAVVEPGVRTKTLQEAAEEQRLYYPPDPASRADCSIGGNIATNAGGPRCLKYGVTRDYVLGLEVVLANGDIVKLGSRTHKNKTGFDLSRFFVGSEGMLGIVTEATLKLLPLPPYRACLAVGLHSMAQAAGLLDAIFAAGFLPSALEVADAFTLAAAVKRTGDQRLAGCEAHLIIEVDGQESSVKSEIPTLQEIAKTFTPKFIERAFGPTDCEAIWQLRREFSYSLRDTGLTKLNEDIVVPRSRLLELFEFAAQLQSKYGMPVACFGHAGDGNIHVNIMVDRERPDMVEKSEAALDELFQNIIAMHGVITGEHGIGLAKKKWWPLAASENVQKLHRTVKAALDPRGILNPGKFL